MGLFFLCPERAPSVFSPYSFAYLKNNQYFCICFEHGIWLYSCKFRQSKVLAFAFGLSAEIERNLISQRTKEALARLKSEGKYLGRPSGKCSNKQCYKLHSKEKLIRQMRAQGDSFYRISKALGVNRNTVRRYYANFIENPSAFECS